MTAILQGHFVELILVFVCIGYYREQSGIRASKPSLKLRHGGVESIVTGGDAEQYMGVISFRVRWGHSKQYGLASVLSSFFAAIIELKQVSLSQKRFGYLGNVVSVDCIGNDHSNAPSLVDDLSREAVLGSLQVTEMIRTTWRGF